MSGRPSKLRRDMRSFGVERVVAIRLRRPLPRLRLRLVDLAGRCRRHDKSRPSSVRGHPPRGRSSIQTSNGPRAPTCAMLRTTRTFGLAGFALGAGGPVAPTMTAIFSSCSRLRRCSDSSLALGVAARLRRLDGDLPSRRRQGSRLTPPGPVRTEHGDLARDIERPRRGLRLVRLALAQSCRRDGRVDARRRRTACGPPPPAADACSNVRSAHAPVKPLPRHSDHPYQPLAAPRRTPQARTLGLVSRIGTSS
jgi:hypothetical protein